MKRRGMTTQDRRAQRDDRRNRGRSVAERALRQIRLVAVALLLLGRSGGSRSDRRGGAGRRLLPETLHGLVLERLAAQSIVAQRRTVHLLEGLS